MSALLALLVLLAGGHVVSAETTPDGSAVVRFTDDHACWNEQDASGRWTEDLCWIAITPEGTIATGP